MNGVKMTVQYAVEFIIREGEEEKAINMLLSSLCRENKELSRSNAEMRACLKAIHKINGAFVKNDSIASLSEEVKDGRPKHFN